MCNIRQTAKSFRTKPRLGPVLLSEIYLHIMEVLTATAEGLSNPGARATDGTLQHKHGYIQRRKHAFLNVCSQSEDVPASTGRIRNASDCNKKVRRHFFNIILELNIPGDTNSSDPPPPPSSLAHLSEPLHSTCPDNKWRIQKDSSFIQQQPTLA